ncbi:hypothetical protein HN873_012933 [Arachis hypogaea]
MNHRRPHTLDRSRLSSTMSAALNRSAIHLKQQRHGAPFHGSRHVALLHGLMRIALLHGRQCGHLLHARCSTSPPLPVLDPHTRSSSKNPSPSPASSSSPISPSPLLKLSQYYKQL